MASVFSLQLSHLRLRPRQCRHSSAGDLPGNRGSVRCHCHHPTSSPHHSAGSDILLFRQVLCSASAVRDEPRRSDSAGGSLSNRREALGGFLFSVLSFPLLAVKDAAADTELVQEFQTYKDENERFSISFPKEWVAGVADASGFKSITAFLPQEVSDSNVTVAITGLGPDFTRLESFGKVDEFAESLVNGLDRSWKDPPGLAAKLINAKAANGFYYIEYTLQNPGERCRHIFSAIGMANNGWYNRLYTVTGQYLEDESEKYRYQIEKIVSSFRFI